MANDALFDPHARYLQLDERVTNLRGSVSHLEQKVDAGFSHLGQQLSGLSAEFRSGQTTKWQLIWPAAAVALSFSVVIGSLAYFPIREANTEMKNSIRELAAAAADMAVNMPEKFPTRRETEALRARGTEDRARVEASIKDIRDNTVTRYEWAERNRARDIEVTDISRRLEEMRSDFGDIYGTRDVIQDLQEQLRRLESEVYPSR